MSRRTTDLGGFTRVQSSELYQQTLVSSKFIAAPLQFALPIREGDSSVGIKEEVLDSENNIMDPEVNRCRRTDGKKWRCRKTVIPNQKYCENHMHRGRQRSRKPVEVPNKETPSNITVSGKLEDSNEIPLRLPLVTDNSDCSMRAVDGCSGKRKSSIPEATVTCAIVVGSASATNLNLSSSKDSGFVSSVEEKPKAQRCSIGEHVSTKRDAVAAMLGCSPTSVLLGNNGNGNGVEQWRCKRTDGKRWRCGRGVLPNQKYCERHIHRVGRKPPADTSKLINTNRLSVSVTVLDNNKGKSCSSSNSSDTTLTDSAREDRSCAVSS